MKKDAQNIPESFALDKSKLKEAIRKPLKAIIDGFAHAGAAAAGHSLPKPSQEKPKQAPAPVKKVDPKTRLPGTLMEKGSMKSLLDKSKNLATALEQKTMKKNDQEWVNKMAKHLSLKKDDAKTGATPPPPINSQAGAAISQSFNNATGTSGIMQGIKNVGSALGFGKTEDKPKEDKPKEEKPKDKPVDAMDIIAHPRSVKKGGDFTQINSEPILQRSQGSIPRPTNWTPDHVKKLKNHVSTTIMGGPIAATTQASTGTTPGAGGLAQSEKSHLKKDGASPPPTNTGAQSAQASMRQAFHFGKNEPMKKDDPKYPSNSINMQIGNPFKQPGAPPKQPGVQKNNPDMKQDAKLGENVEHLVEDHMVQNKDAEQKEGHKIQMKKCDDPAFLKQLHGSLKLKKMYGMEMTEKSDKMPEKSQDVKPHDSSKGAPTQDEKHANEMNKAETLKKPYVSQAQAGFFHTNPEKVGGAKVVHEWDQATKGKHLPKKK